MSWPHRARARDGLAADRRLVTNRDPERIYDDDRIHRLERTALPRRHLGLHRIGDATDEVWGDLHGGHLEENRLDLAHRQATGVQRDDGVVEAGAPPLLFADSLGLTGALPIARDGQRQRALVRQDRFGAVPLR